MTMGYTVENIQHGHEPAIYPHSATYAGMLRRDTDQALTMREFLALSTDPGGAEYPLLRYYAERVRETGEVGYRADYKTEFGVMSVFAIGEPA